MAMMLRKSLQLPLCLWLCASFLCSRSLVPVEGIRISPSDVSSTGTKNSIVNADSSLPSEVRRNRVLVDVPTPSNPDEHLVQSLPFLDEGELPVKQFAGHLPASPNGDKFFFYWLFEPDTTEVQKNDADIPLLIWLNGGPGCSSMDGLFLENGPFGLHVSPDNEWKLQANPHSWHKSPAYVVYIDQPVGTGLSFTTGKNHPRNDKEINRDFYFFLKQFLQVHADKFLNGNELKRPLYFSGESHAGHYIPSMISYILDQNSRNSADNKHLTIPVAGAAIGNGWVDPVYQYAAAEAAYGLGIIDLAQKASLDIEERTCQQALARKEYTDQTCFHLLGKVVNQSHGKALKTTVSQYDASKIEPKNKPRTFPPGHKDVESYLGGHATTSDRPTMPAGVTEKVLEAIHATAAGAAGQTYYECTDPPYYALAHQDGLGVVPDVVRILEKEKGGKTRLLFFNGVLDLICNHVGNERTLQNLPWKHRDDWTKSKRYAWRAKNGGQPVSGYMKEYENLLFLKVLGSGHMVPMDMPEIALEMMQIFMYGQSFDESEQKMQTSLENNDKADCPMCPTCDAMGSDNASDTLQQSSDVGQDTPNELLLFIVAHSWLVALVGVMVFFFAMIFFRGRCNGTLTGTGTQQNSGYDLELRETGERYHDGFEDDPDDRGTYSDDAPSIS